MQFSTDVLSMALNLCEEHKPFKIYIDLSRITDSKNLFDAKHALNTRRLQDKMTSFDKILRLIDLTASNPESELIINPFSSKTITESLKEGDVIVTADKQAFEPKNCTEHLLRIKCQQDNDFLFVSERLLKKRISEVMSAVYRSDMPCMLVVKRS